MYLSAYLLLVASFLCAVFFAGASLLTVFQGRQSMILPWAERAHSMISAFMTVSCALLVYAFVTCDFSVKYVAQYSDLTLPLFYRLTAFWAGQAGSMLFWAWSVALGGILFTFLPAYARLSDATRLWFWIFFFSVMAFFLLILTVWSNPFTTFAMTPQDGNGLNPLLQNPGMIFHPPLLFLGYGGFTVPGCLALAQAMTGRLAPLPASPDPEKNEEPWGQISRPFILIAWSLLSAGIILGAWWAYMELGWGGYWAWDPVENASLIPWLVATAYLHTAVVESRRGKLRRINVFLMALTTFSAFFATYLVRSGVVESLHAFGDGGVGLPLLNFTLGGLCLALFIACSSRENSRPLADILSKEGLLVLVAWVLLALSVIVLIATMWPVILTEARGLADLLSLTAAGIPDKPMGLDPAFYNRVCLPLFATLAVLLAFCPHLQWKSGVTHKAVLPALLLITAATVAGLYIAGIRHPVSMLASAFGLSALCGLFLLFAVTPSLLRIRTTIAAHGVHLGLLLIIIGVAFSGPYQLKADLELARGESAVAHGYRFHLTQIYEGAGQFDNAGRPNYQYIEAELLVSRDGKKEGILSPQRRLYSNFEKQTFSEVATLFSLGTEVYATFTSLDEQGRALISVHINPLVNWLWIGGILLCLFPFLGLGRAGRIRDRDAGGAAEQTTNQGNIC